MSRIRNLSTTLAALMLAAGPSLGAIELQSIPGTDTRLSLNGFIYIYGNYYANAVQQQFGYEGSLFYNSWGAGSGSSGSALDTHALADNQFLLTYQPTRFSFNTVTPSASVGDITTKIEYDMNGSSTHLRHAYLKFGGWTIGQAFSLWNDYDAYPDTVCWAGAIGTPAFYAPRLPVVQYQAKFDQNNWVGISLEQNSGHPAGSAGAGDAHLPTVIAAYSFSDKWGHVGLRAMAQNYGTFIAATATAPKVHYNKEECAFMLTGDIKVGKDDFVWNVYTGNAVGPYGVGFQAALFNDATHTITAYKNVGWGAAYVRNWTDKVRSNFVLSGVSFSSDSSLPATSSTTGTAMKTGLSAYVNTYVMLSKSLQLGIEYQYEQAKPFKTNGATDSNDHPASSNANNAIIFGMKATF